MDDPQDGTGEVLNKSQLRQLEKLALIDLSGQSDGFIDKLQGDINVILRCASQLKSAAEAGRDVAALDSQYLSYDTLRVDDDTQKESIADELFQNATNTQEDGFFLAPKD